MRDLNRIELLAETLRTTLNAVAAGALTDANRNSSRVRDVRDTDKRHFWRTSYEDCFSGFAGQWSWNIFDRAGPSSDDACPILGWHDGTGCAERKWNPALSGGPGPTGDTHEADDRLRPDRQGSGGRPR